MTLPRPFGAYVLERSLARGGMGQIFVAHTDTPGFKKRVCIKQVGPPTKGASDFAAMFRDEAALAARLHHPNIVQVFDFGEVDGSLYLAMEYVEGMTLGALLKEHAIRRYPLELSAGLQIGIAVCRALQHAHALTGEQGQPLGVVHRDVSPSNVLLSALGEVKLADFGIARAADRLVTTKTGLTKGKGAYMAPEQATAEPVDHRTDQFAVGILLWEMLTCRRLFRAKTELEAMQKVVEADVLPPSSARVGIPEALDRAVLRALAREPERRFPDMAALEAALSASLFEVAKTPEDLDLRLVVRRALDQSWAADSDDANTVPNWRTMGEDTLPVPRAPELTESGATHIDHHAPVEREETEKVPVVPTPAAVVPSRAVEVRSLPVVQESSDDSPARAALPVVTLAVASAALIVVVIAVALGQSASREARLERAPVVVRTVPISMNAASPARELAPDVPQAEPVVDASPPLPASAEGPSAQDIAAAIEPPPEPEERGHRRSGATRAKAKTPSLSSSRTASPSPMELAAELERMEQDAMRALITGKASSAATLFREVARREPRRATAYRGLGQASEAIGRKREALAAYRVYLSLSPGAPDREQVGARITELSR